MPSVSIQNLTAPGLWPRLASWLYEGILLFGMSFVAGYAFSALTQSRHALMHRTGLMIFLFIVYGIYFSWCWHKGQTLAMKTWRLQLVNHQGHRVPLAQATLRYLFSWIWFVPPLTLAWLMQLTPTQAGFMLIVWIVIWAASSRLHHQRQFWHDAWAKTYVVVYHAPNERGS